MNSTINKLLDEIDLEKEYRKLWEKGANERSVICGGCGKASRFYGMLLWNCEWWHPGCLREKWKKLTQKLSVL